MYIMSLSKPTYSLFSQVWDNLLCFYTDSLNVSTNMVYDLLGLHAANVRSIYIQSPQLALVDVVLSQPGDMDMILSCAGVRFYKGQTMFIRIVPCWKELVSDFVSDYVNYLATRKLVHGAINPDYFYLNPGFLPVDALDNHPDWDSTPNPASATQFDPDKIIKVESDSDNDSPSQAEAQASTSPEASSSPIAMPTTSSGSRSGPAPGVHSLRGIILPPIDSSSDDDTDSSPPRRVIRIQPRSPSTSPPI